MKTQLYSYQPSIDALLFSVLAGAYMATRFMVELPQSIPGSHGLTAILVLFLGVYWALDVGSHRRPDLNHRITPIKWTIAVFAIFLITVASTILAVWWRHNSAPHQYVHDGLIQSEYAVEYLLTGRNPYSVDFTDTPMADWPFREGQLTTNPALFHYPYMPLTFLFPLPFQVAIKPLLGWFDHRLVYLGVFAGTLLLTTSLAVQPTKRLSLLLILGLNPIFVPFLVEGRNDILPLFWLMLTIALLQKQRFTGSSVTLAFACATKQLSWLFVPFYFIYISGHGTLSARLGRAARPFLIYSLTFGALIVPSLLWNPVDFLNDILVFQTGLSSAGYPIKGFGFGVLLMFLGIIPSNTTYFPFWIFQALIGLPLLIVLLRQNWQESHLNVALSGYALCLLVISFFSRAFNENYLGFITAIMALAVFMDRTAISPAREQA